jgi:prepilin-type N-terminal cleavage/methylation domain-containing protein
MRRGVTLVELLVVLALIGLLLGLSALVVGRPRSAGIVGGRAEKIVQGRAQAIRIGKAVRIRGDSGAPVLLLPDGRVVGAGLDPLSGATGDAP